MNMKYFFAFAVVALLFSSCETEVELNAPYKSTTVVYGLLDPVQDTQWIKINRTFLGDGNNFDYALVRDSSEYDFSEFKRLVVEEYLDGNKTNEWALQEKEITNKSINGIFYGPLQTVYFFRPAALNQNAEYRLVIDFFDREDVEATTPLVQPNEITFVNLTSSQGLTISMATKTGENSFEFNTLERSFRPDDSAPFYEVVVRFNYTEKKYTDATHTTLVSETPKHVDYFCGSYTSEDSESGKIRYTVDGEAFFNLLGNTLTNDPSIVYQIGTYDPTFTPAPETQCFETIIYAGGSELYTYIQVNTPTSGVVQERPTYSNVSNGIGLFSSRSTAAIRDIPLINSNPQQVPNTGNALAFRFSEYTNMLNFCDPGNMASGILTTCE